MEKKPAKEIKIDDGHFELFSLREVTIEEFKEELLCTKIRLLYMGIILKKIINEREEYTLPNHYISIIEVIEKLANDSLGDVNWLCDCKIKNTDTTPV